ncbi:hypothetical protein TGME49_297510 [Toxoplasma gondii ME49]|uniref:Transmembrane protein n=2 Tax=Toxoplasma gondii TaxID=5811 RepID=S8GUA4_TOXGM|nr:hypothetical protein TGME49_297510 [Toxoplasma gondii ME49]EPT32174.1 hypothetical protein TGME49_297510 [Toxoplasma gondii ME49]KYF42477.1 hypothetical protein TGARI_297510 [Toxoplasma gondii ARI]|eukprot:XP_002371181.1 hypothetical protein TGME49_297510 [Toxoplasma gondii ME49]
MRRLSFSLFSFLWLCLPGVVFFWPSVLLFLSAASFLPSESPFFSPLFSLCRSLYLPVFGALLRPRRLPFCVSASLVCILCFCAFCESSVLFTSSLDSAIAPSCSVWIRSVYAQPLDVEFSWNMQWLRADPFNNSAWMFRQFLANEKAEGKSERGKTRCAGRRLREVAASAPATADGKQSEDAYKQDEEEQDIDRRPETQKTEKTGERPSEEGKRRNLRRKANVWTEEVRFALVSWNAHPSNEAACRYLLHAAKQALGALRQIERDEIGDSSEATVETKHSVSDWSAAVDDAAQKDANDANDPEIDSPRLLHLLRRSAERVCEEVATCYMQRPSSSSSPSSLRSDSSASFSNQANDEGAKKQTAAFPDSRGDERPSCPRGEQKGALRFALEMLLFCAIEQGRLCDACTTCMHLAEVDPIRRAYWTWRSEAFASQ